ncbi:helix-turn-helix domain-containing protein [Nocardia sp. CDC159]|uniref:Helix-turn-helix domain-containing protein n=1 Tax=Nocardia pulmonis TaxID=2951408 RepID=A0A9X2IWY8_9NOCA|nr:MULTISPECIES: helix-turn-helix transcriptional regulator [Nocardia]MCM6774833.1 helix-turn-helix domain-containing protein [Nocardia pulmonis]MCM6789764.1 helix-turn-helix domain-containing protein [Nocardia sp. CDC159]
MAQDPEVSDQNTGESAETTAADRVARVANAAHDIGSFIRAQREAAQVSLRQLAQLAGVSNPYLSQIERGLRNPSAEVLAQIAKGLRVSSEVLYMRAGYLEQRPHSPVRDALLADTGITERQKQVLLDIYESFRRENAGNDIGGDATESTGGVPGGNRDNEVPHQAADGTTEVPRQENETS